jgi:hypothetical protein
VAATPLRSAPSAITGEAVATFVGLLGAVDLEC